MTNEEKAIVMAYTGVCMLSGTKFHIFHEYVEKLMGRPIYTHELGFLADEIKEKAKDDFIKLCEEEDTFNEVHFKSIQEAYKQGYSDGIKYGVEHTELE